MGQKSACQQYHVTVTHVIPFAGYYHDMYGNVAMKYPTTRIL